MLTELKNKLAETQNELANQTNQIVIDALKRQIDDLNAKIAKLEKSEEASLLDAKKKEINDLIAVQTNQIVIDALKKELDSLGKKSNNSRVKTIDYDYVLRIYSNQGALIYNSNTLLHFVRILLNKDYNNTSITWQKAISELKELFKSEYVISHFNIFDVRNDENKLLKRENILKTFSYLLMIREINDLIYFSNAKNYGYKFSKDATKQVINVYYLDGDANKKPSKSDLKFSFSFDDLNKLLKPLEKIDAIK